MSNLQSYIWEIYFRLSYSTFSDKLSFELKKILLNG